jgi:hypothetical protein
MSDSEPRPGLGATLFGLLVIAMLGYGAWEFRAPLLDGASRLFDSILPGTLRTISDDLVGAVDLSSRTIGAPTGANGRDREPRPAAAPAPSPAPAPDPVPEPGPATAPRPAPAAAAPAPAPSIAEIDRILDSLGSASLAFNGLDDMLVGDIRAVQVILSPAHSREEVARLLTEAGTRHARTIRFSPVMRAELGGLAFDVDPGTPQEQPVSGLEPTTWKWQVRAKEAGTHTLTLTLWAVVSIDGRERARQIKTFDETVEVRVGAGRSVAAFVKEWIGVLGTIAGRVGGGGLIGLLTWYRKRRRAARIAGARRQPGDGRAPPAA